MATPYGIIEQLTWAGLSAADIMYVAQYLDAGIVAEEMSPNARRMVDMIAGAGLNDEGVKTVRGFLSTGTQPEAMAAAWRVPENEIIARYGYGAWALQHPELGPILRQAAAEGWDGATIQGELVKTQWWQTHSAAARDYLELKGRDPASAQLQLDNAKTAVRIAAGRLGVALDDAKVTEMAEASIVNAWQGSDLTYAIGAEARRNPAAAKSGEVASVLTELKKRAGAYFVAFGDDVLNAAAVRIATGEDSIDGWTQSTLIPQAMSRFNSPALRDAVAKGTTLAEFFEPARQLLAQTLELAPDSVNLMDPRWSRVLESDDGKGNLRPMTLSEVAKFARSQSEWWDTRQAKQSEAELANFLETKTGMRMSGGI